MPLLLPHPDDLIAAFGWTGGQFRRKYDQPLRWELTEGIEAIARTALARMAAGILREYGTEPELREFMASFGAPPGQDSSKYVPQISAS